jgi:hypothetical protein
LLLDFLGQVGMERQANRNNHGFHDDFLKSFQCPERENRVNPDFAPGQTR